MKTVILFALIALFGGIIVLDISRKLRILEGVDGTDSIGADAKTAPTTDADAKTAPTTDADAKTAPTTDADAKTAPTTDADAKTAPTTESAVEKCGESAPVSVLRYSAY